MSLMAANVRGRTSLVISLVVAIGLGLVGGWAIRAEEVSPARAADLRSDTARGTRSPTSAGAPGATVPSPTSTGSGETEPPPGPETGSTGESAGGSARPGAGPGSAQVPESGSGRFTTAPGGSGRAGAGGRLVRYRVIVEAEAPVEPAVFSAAVEATLADPRGWTASGRWSFQRVDDATGADLLVHLATPATTDRICGAYGLHTRGEVSCRGGSNVVINLRRWQLGVPWYADALAEYRHMLINHEVGHYLGNGHVACPGPGQPAPVMQTQTYSLNGCARNWWPYPDGHTYVTGPSS